MLLRHDVTGAYQALAPNRPWNRVGVKGALVRRTLAAGLQRRSAPHLCMTDVQQHVTPLFDSSVGRLLADPSHDSR